MSVYTTNPVAGALTGSSDGDAVIRREKAIAYRSWVPGEAGIWALIFTDLAVFSVYFCTFMYQWVNQRATFAAGHREVSLLAGILNTFFLLTASLFVALGVQHIRRGQVIQTQRLFLTAGIAGLAFVVNKYFEWSDKLESGHTPRSDTFFQFYFILTGIHLVHVLIAMALLYFMFRRAGRVNGSPTHQQMQFIENGASYWHMVDLLWLVLFALFYLMGSTA